MGCNILRNGLCNRAAKIIKDDEEIKVNLFLGPAPYALDHMVIELKGSLRDLSELGKKEWSILSKWIPRITRAMKKVLEEIFQQKVEKIYICSFNEDENYNVHFHLVPRYQSQKQKRGPAMLINDERLIMPPETIKSIVSKMKRELGENS